ncbi:MAG TPA: DNA recombination protein RmuC [Thermoanaerobaculia bacterium]|nr:DNA recombination protein RmuC [Thermoanaerobaculia bacterium]
MTEWPDSVIIQITAMEPVVIVVSLVTLVLGGAGGFFLAASRRTAVEQRLAAERDHAIRERARSEAAASDLQRRLESEQQLRIAAETKQEAARGTLDDMTGFANALRPLLEESFSQHSNRAAERAIDHLLQVVKPHLDGNRGEIVSTLDTKKLEIEGLMAPIREMLNRYQSELRTSEQQRTEGYAGLQEQIRALLEATRATQQEASKLYGALKAPNIRGTWGESTLRNCVEIAGLSEFCDFDVQMTFETEEKKRLRPDMIVRLPDDRIIAVDAKAPYSSYIEAMEATDEKRRRDLLLLHAASLRRHIVELSRKEYQDNVQKQLDKTLNFTVMFIGSEAFLSSAMIADPSLFELAAEKNIVLASPTILVPLLKALASGWKAERLEENALRALTIGHALYEQFVRIFDNIQAVGKALGMTVARYNTAIGSMDNLVPKGRQLQEYVSSKSLPELSVIEEPLRESVKLQAQTLLPIAGLAGGDESLDPDQDDEQEDEETDLVLERTSES